MLQSPSFHCCRGLKLILYSIFNSPVYIQDFKSFLSADFAFLQFYSTLLSGVQVLEVVDCLASALGALAMVLFVTPAILMVAAPLLFFGYLRVQNMYIATNRELKRLDSIALSPIFSKFSETLSGLITLRAFQKEEQFAEQNKELIDESNRAWWPMQV